MKNITYILILLMIGLNAQNYQWEWAIGGGGEEGAQANTFRTLRDEMIRDIAVDNEGNAYYLTTLFGDTPVIGTEAITHYSDDVDTNLLLFSTDCQGNLRWARAIGGEFPITEAWNIAIDNNNGLYLFVKATSPSHVGGDGQNLTPVHFDDDITLPINNVTGYDGITPLLGFKTGYLLKYNTHDGHLAWQKPLQGDVYRDVRNCDNGVWTMDNENNIHAIIGYKAGTHLDGLITVPDTFTDNYQYYMVKFTYDNGNMTVIDTPLLLPIDGDLFPALWGGKIQLHYNATLNRYYMGGSRSYSLGSFYDFAYSNVPFNKDGYVLAFDGATGQEIWRKVFTTYFQGGLANNPDSKIFSLLQDNENNIYISGFYSNTQMPSEEETPTFGDYILPMSGDLGITMNYVMKMDAEGNVIWIKIPEALENHPEWNGTRSTRARIALNGEEIAFVKGANNEAWDSFEITRPLNTPKDPLLVRLDNATGNTLAVHEILGSTYWDEMTSVAVDNHGNYIVGGYYYGPFFLDPNDGIPTLNDPSNGWESNFFVAKLAKTNCEGEPLKTEEINQPKQTTSIYPNPVYDVLFVKSKTPLQSYEIFNSFGQIIKTGLFKTNDYKLILKSIPTGSYNINIYSKKGKTNHMFLKK